MSEIQWKPKRLSCIHADEFTNICRDCVAAIHEQFASQAERITALEQQLEDASDLADGRATKIAILEQQLASQGAALRALIAEMRASGAGSKILGWAEDLEALIGAPDGTPRS